MRSFTTAYADGAYPVGAQALSGGYLYGFTQQGTTGYGSFYKQTVAGAVTTLNNFTGVAPNVYYPNAGPVVGASPSTMYATCMYGGTGGIGMVFSISTGGVVTDLHSFTGGTTDGSTPYGGVIFASDGMLYGTTFGGGLYSNGIVYKLDPVTKVFTVLHHFNSAVDGYYPMTALCEGPDGKLYGSLYWTAGASGGVYSLTKSGSDFAILHGFSSADPAGNNPYSDLVRGPGASTKLYGTCQYGGAGGVGAIFSVDTATGAVAAVASFDGYNGATPGQNFGTSGQSRMTPAPSGTLMYGTTRYGGPYGYGTVYKLDTATGVLSLLAGMTRQMGNTSVGVLTLSGATTMYGASYYGGAGATAGIGGAPEGWGSSVSCSTTGLLKSTHSWYLRDGYNPSDGPTTAIGGYLYGTAAYGGLWGFGTIYKVKSIPDASGNYAYTVLHHFNNYVGEGYYPQGGLFKAADGALYGATSAGGVFGAGTLFKCTTAGVVTVIHNFRGSIEGSGTYQKLVQGVGTDKNLYGCLFSGGAGGHGSVYKCSTTGTTFQILHYFTNPDGSNPACQLTVEKDPVTLNTKALYGGSYAGGSHGYGTLFKIVPGTTPLSTTFTKLFDLDYTTGGYIYFGGQMQLIGAGLFGVTAFGGTSGNGVIFKFDLSTGAYSVLRNLNNSLGDGYYPYGGVTTEAVPANLYGTCNSGGPGGSGTVWKYNLGTGTFTVLHNFYGSASGDGSSPYGAVYDPSGLVFGTTLYGGATNNGSVWCQTTTP